MRKWISAVHFTLINAGFPSLSHRFVLALLASRWETISRWPRTHAKCSAVLQQNEPISDQGCGWERRQSQSETLPWQTWLCTRETDLFCLSNWFKSSPFFPLLFTSCLIFGRSPFQAALCSFGRSFSFTALYPDPSAGSSPVTCSLDRDFFLMPKNFFMKSLRTNRNSNSKLKIAILARANRCHYDKTKPKIIESEIN